MRRNENLLEMPTQSWKFEAADCPKKAVWSESGDHFVIATKYKVLVHGGRSYALIFSVDQIYYEIRDMSVMSIKRAPNSMPQVAGKATYVNETKMEMKYENDQVVDFVVAVVGANGLEVYDKLEKTPSIVQLDSQQLMNVEFSENGKFMALSTLDGHLGIWDIEVNGFSHMEIGK